MDIQKALPWLTPEQIELLEAYQKVLMEWNRRMNLVSRKDVENLRENHLIPSIVPLQLLDIPRESWVLDIGSGGGLPAIPWKIVRPDLEILLVDSIRKKTAFLKHVVNTLGLERIAVENERIENLSHRFEYQKKFDIITARAVAAVEKIVQWGRPCLKDRGWFLLWKGTTDIPDLQTAAQKLGLRYKIYAASEEMLTLSRKLTDLRWFAIFPTEGSPPRDRHSHQI